jgi:beta-phosphoglucomutase-like phosphatase (HAD superfamily)
MRRPTDGYKGAIFDVDGVLVDSSHEMAWREGLKQLMENEWSDIRDQTSYSPEKFTPEVYQRVMSGMKQVVKASMEAFGQAGHAGDYEPMTLEEMANRYRELGHQLAAT